MKQFLFLSICIFVIELNQLFGQHIMCKTVEENRTIKKQNPKTGTIQGFENWLAPKFIEFQNDR